LVSVLRLPRVGQGVGKCRDAKGSWRQSNIDQLLLQKAREPPRGRCIVQLKGGNLFLFRRTRTKIDAL
jgi:siroheme synthase